MVIDESDPTHCEKSSFLANISFDHTPAVVIQMIMTMLFIQNTIFCHITDSPGVQKHSAINRKNALVQYRFLLPRFSIKTLL